MNPNTTLKISRFWYLIVPILFLALLVGQLQSVSRVQAQPAEYEGLDIVFIIDQSDSMQRISGANPPNDRLGLRFYGPWYAMYWMGEDRLLVHEDITFRASVVNFGSPGNVEVWDFGNGRYWQEIDPDSRSAWEPLFDDLTQQIEVDMRDRFLAESLGATSFADPFEAAKTLFDDLPEASGTRRRVIVVLTDGMPSGPIGGASINVDNHMTALQLYAEQNFPEPDYLIYVISMIDAGQAYWDDVEPYWETITNDPCTNLSCPDPSADRASIVASNDDVGKRFQEILQDLVANFPTPEDLIVVESEVIPGPLVVPPYLKSIDFTFFKTSPLERLILTDPAGSEIVSTRDNVTIEGEDGPIQVIRITNPDPGNWFVATNPPNTEVDITMRQIFAQSRLSSPLQPQTQYLPVSVEYVLLDELGNNLPFYSDPDYRLIVSAVISADGQTWPIPLREQQGNVYQADFTPVLAASHTISVHAESQDLNGNPIVVYDGVIGGFEVGPAVLTPLELPTRMQQYDEAEFVFELQDSRGFQIVTDVPVAVNVEVGGEPGGSLALSREADGTYRETYSPQRAGAHTIDVEASVTDNEGNLFVLTQESLGEFEVVTTNLLELRLTAPLTETQEHTELLPWNKNPLVVELELRDENNNLVDANDVFLGDAAKAIELTMVDEEGNDVSEVLTLTLTAVPGIYYAETEDVNLGSYTIHAEAVDGLQVGYLFEDDPVVDTTITRVRHPLHIPIAISTTLALVAIGAVVYVSRKRYLNITAHPCTGRVYLVDYASVPQWQLGLDSYNRNRIVVGGGFPAITRITKMQFECVSDEDNKNGRVQVKIWIDKSKTPIVDRSLGSKSEVRVGSLNFWLLKDPTDEQLSRDRMGKPDTTPEEESYDSGFNKASSNSYSDWD